MKSKTIHLTKRERELLLSLINRAEIERDQKAMYAQGARELRRKLPPLRQAAFKALEIIEAKLLDELE